MRALLLFITISTLFVAPLDAAKKPEAGTRGFKKVADALNDYLSSLGPEEQWDAWVAQYGPVYGNYCGPAHGDATFEQPCLSQLDCLCKEHDFGYSLRRYREADEIFAQQVFNAPIAQGKKNADYEDFIKVMAATLFAGRISGQNLYNDIMASYGEYQKNPEQAKKSLVQLIDETEVFKQKIEDIRKERQKYEDAQAKMPLVAQRTMAVAVQPFSIFLGVIGLNFEWRAEKWVSLRSGISLLGSGLVSDTYLKYGNNKEFSVFASFGPKFYVAGESFKNGVYLEPRVEAGYESVVDKAPGSGQRVQGLSVIPAFLVGFDKVFASGIQVDLGLGLGYHLSAPLSNVPDGFNTFFFVPKFQASIGWAW